MRVNHQSSVFLPLCYVLCVILLIISSSMSCTSCTRIVSVVSSSPTALLYATRPVRYEYEHELVFLRLLYRQLLPEMSCGVGSGSLRASLLCSAQMDMRGSNFFDLPCEYGTIVYYEHRTGAGTVRTIIYCTLAASPFRRTVR